MAGAGTSNTTTAARHTSPRPHTSIGSATLAACPQPDGQTRADTATPPGAGVRQQQPFFFVRQQVFPHASPDASSAATCGANSSRSIAMAANTREKRRLCSPCVIQDSHDPYHTGTNFPFQFPTSGAATSRDVRLPLERRWPAKGPRAKQFETVPSFRRRNRLARAGEQLLDCGYRVRGHRRTRHGRTVTAREHCAASRAVLYSRTICRAGRFHHRTAVLSITAAAGRQFSLALRLGQNDGSCQRQA